MSGSQLGMKIAKGNMKFKNMKSGGKRGHARAGE